ncbi:MAG: hypothetical protein JW958_04390 [Candidatus Eisenbacteria bacterium]|nr:hypothetical protein [Candidatus Eisenbacteria bacterium]
MASKQTFSPLIYLASLGAGGISVIPFAFLQYTHPHPKGLVRIEHLAGADVSAVQQALFFGLEAVMILFVLIHVVLSLAFLPGLIRWIRGGEYSDFMRDPLKNGGILAPFISLCMTMNVFVGPVRFFIPGLADNLQGLMLPALIGWAILWFFVLRMEIKLMRISFVESFDYHKVSFGWLLHPFALGMITVTGTGFAALAQSPAIAHTAAFLSLVSGTLGLFLLGVKLISVFNSHFAARGLPEKQSLPSFLIVVPNVTLYAISGYRLMHYLHAKWDMHTEVFSFLIITLSFAFELWYVVFGLRLLSDYLKNHFPKREFYVTQWGFVCPVVAFAVLGSFFYKVFVPNPLTYAFVLLTALSAVVLFFHLLKKQCRCSGLLFCKPDGECM